MKKRSYPGGDHALLIALLALMAVSWIAQLVSGWYVFVADAGEHHVKAEWLGTDGYLMEFTRATMENWQSEFLQLATFVLLSTYLIFRDSPQSRDGDDDQRDQLTRIENQQTKVLIHLGIPED